MFVQAAWVVLIKPKSWERHKFIEIVAWAIEGDKQPNSVPTNRGHW